MSVNFKMSFWCLQIFQKTKEIFSRISALASKKKSNQKNKDFIPLIGGFYFDSLILLFWFDILLEAKILEKISFFFWKIWRHQKDILKLTYL